MAEIWTPLAQDGESVLYGDLRLVSDDSENREGNLGLGYRHITRIPILGAGVAGVHGWLDRRVTERGSTFYQTTLGAEWLGERFDVLANAYIPLSSEKRYGTDQVILTGSTPLLIGTGIFLEGFSGVELIEEPQAGFDLDVGMEIPFVEDYVDSARIYVGGYYFDGDYAPKVAGGRVRLAVDVTPNFQVGARFQHDEERGSQGFVEATLRLPLGRKRSFREHGLAARLDDSPERDIDIVTGDDTTLGGPALVPILNTATGEPHQIIYVDNTAPAGGDGSSEAPLSTLAAAQAAAREYMTIYVRPGDGATTGQNQGIVLDQVGLELTGSGADFLYDPARFVPAGGIGLPPSVLIPATTAPVITNTGGDGVNVRADNVRVAGVTINSAIGSGIYALNVGDLSVDGVTLQDNGLSGIVVELYDMEGRTVTTAVRNSISSGNLGAGLEVFMTSGDLNFISEGNIIIDNNVALSLLAGGSSHEAGALHVSILEDFYNENFLGVDLFSFGHAAMDVTINDVLVQNTSAAGALLGAQSDAYFSADIDNLRVLDAGGAGFLEYGIEIISHDRSVVDVAISNSTSSGAVEHGIIVFELSDSSGTNLDLGGGTLGSTGGNRIYGNGKEDIYLQGPAITVYAQDNWWGSAAGPDPSQISAINPGSVVYTSPWLTTDPGI